MSIHIRVLHHCSCRFLKKGSQCKIDSHTIFSIILKQQIGNEDMITLVENNIPTTDKHIISKFNFVHLDASERVNIMVSSKIYY